MAGTGGRTHGRSGFDLLNGLNKIALALHPSGQADGDLHTLLLQAIERPWDARQERLLAAQTTIPDIVWFDRQSPADDQNA